MVHNSSYYSHIVYIYESSFTVYLYIMLRILHFGALVHTCSRVSLLSMS